MSDKPSFFSELRRRNVCKVAVAYIVAGWALSQGIAQVFPVFDVPNWSIRLIVLLIMIGFPVAVVFAWAFEITPEGIKRTEDVDPIVVAHAPKKHLWIYVVTIGAMVSIALFFLGRYTARSSNDASNFPGKSIAVLPFENLSGDPENAYFTDGIQEEILTRLSKIADLKVISRTSTQRYKSAPENLPDIAKQLGVAHILEGSVQKASDQVRVNVQLINALNDAHLWAETYDRKLSDMFAVESEIAKVVADTLQAKLTGQEQRAIAVRPTENSEAHQSYLQGRFFWNKRTTADLRKAIDYFNQALAKDSSYALAYAGLAQTWMLFPAYNGGAPADCYPKAAEAARKALELDNTLSDAVTVLASLKAIYEFDFTGSAREYERAIQLNPNDATAHHWFATDVLTFTGQQTRQLAEMKRALELDPLSLIINSNLGVAYVYNDRLDEAIAQFRKTIDLDDNFAPGHSDYALALALQGKISNAIAECEKAVSTTDDPNRLGLLGYLYGLADRKDEAHDTLEKLRQLRAQRYTLAYSLALASLGVNDKAQAVTWLEQGYADRDGENMGKIRVDPLLKSLHGDPRFEALAEKIVPGKPIPRRFEMKIDNFFAELKRRNVIRMAGLYLVGAWLLTQVASTLLPAFDVPSWALRGLIVTLALGFIPAVIFSWVFELTPEGLKRDEEVSPEQSIAPQTARRMDRMIIVVLVLALGYFAFDKFALAPRREAALVSSGVPNESKSVINAKSIAVLPFENLSEEKANAFFTEGVQDEILTNLSRIADLKVISRTSVMQYKSGAPRNLREIGQQLGVAHVVEGSVQRAANKIRVNAQLIDARNDAHLWAQTYDRDLADVFAIQSEIAKAIADQLQAKLSPNEKKAIEQPPTTDLAAFDLYSRAKSLLLTAGFSTTGDPDLQKAIDLLDEAVKRDPSFFDAYCQLAYTHEYLYAVSGSDHTPARLALAEAAVQAVTRLRPDAAETHLARAQYLYYGLRDYAGALAQLEIARQGLPNDPRLLELTGYILRRRGQQEEGLRNLERAVELDPRNFYTLQQIALSYQNLRRYAEAIAALDRALAIVPDNVETRANRGEFYVYWKADTRPLHQTIDAILAQGPSAIASAATNWFACALAERDPAAAERALVALGDNPCWGEGVIYLSRSFGEGLLARMTKDEPRARTAFEADRAQQEKIVQAQPDYGPALCVLGLIDAALGRKELALDEGRRAIALMPLEKDVFNGSRVLQYFAITAAWAGDKELALQHLEAGLRAPVASEMLSYGALKLFPVWDPLRGDPRFEQIVTSLAPKEPPK